MPTAHRISVPKLLQVEGYEDLEEFLNEVGFDSVQPALCSEGCQVEPDGRCPHGFPSILLALGYI